MTLRTLLTFLSPDGKVVAGMLSGDVFANVTLGRFLSFVCVMPVADGRLLVTLLATDDPTELAALVDRFRLECEELLLELLVGVDALMLETDWARGLVISLGGSVCKAA